MNASAELACSHTTLEQLSIFRRAATTLASTFELDETLANTIAAFLPALGDFGFFDAVMDGGVRRTALAHGDARLTAMLSSTRWQRQEHPELNLCALTTGAAALHRDIDDAWYRRIARNDEHLAVLRALDFSAMLTVPVRCGDELIGALTLFMAASGRRYLDGDLPFAAELAALAAPVVSNARLLARQRQAEEALRASEARLRLAVGAGDMGVWQWDMGNGRSWWWPGMDRLHGLAPGTQVGTVDAYLDLLVPEDRPRLHSVLQELVQTRRDYQVEYRVRLPDGGVRWLEGRGRVEVDDSGTIVQVAGVCVDITQRKRTEEDLRFVARASEELAALDDINATLQRVARLAVPSFADWCALDMLRADDTIERVAVGHVDPDKVRLGHELFERYRPERDDPAGVWQILRSGRSELMTYLSDEFIDKMTRDDEHRAAVHALGLRSYIGVPLAVRGRTVGVMSFVTAESARQYNADDLALAEDIGRRAAIAIDNAKLYRAVQAADRRKDEFLAMLAHELRNPLAPIRAAADLLALQRGDARQERISAVISRQVGHMTALVDDLLDVSRVTRGNIVLDCAPVDLKLVAASAVEQVRPLVDARNHRLRVFVSHEPMTVSGDEKRLVQIVANLLNNAAKYTPPGGDIALDILVDRGAGQSQPQVQIEVRDNGIGMSAEMVASAFELFSQAARAADRSQGGLGLGLALVRRLVELHGGQVRAFSKGEGQGSRFVVRLPALPARSASLPEHSGAAHADAPLRVLIVDDNVDAANVLGAYLDNAGHQTDICYDPFTALARAARRGYDVCLLDIGLPGMDGNTLARRIRAECGTPQPVLIAVSGYGQAHDRSAALAAGFDHYLVKPVGAIDLPALLGQLRCASPLAHL